MLVQLFSACSPQCRLHTLAVRLGIQEQERNIVDLDASSTSDTESHWFLIQSSLLVFNSCLIKMLLCQNAAIIMNCFSQNKYHLKKSSFNKCGPRIEVSYSKTNKVKVYDYLHVALPRRLL